MHDAHIFLIRKPFLFARTPLTLKLLKIALDDNLEAIEKLIGTIQLPREMLDALAEQKAKADEASESEGSRSERGRQLRRPYCNFGGCSSLVIQACISDICRGSAPSHWTHWNLRPPVFATTKCIGLRHFGHLRGVGGGRSWGMTLTWIRPRAYRTRCRRRCRGRDGDTKSLGPLNSDCLYGFRLRTLRI
jgi:hypothetical protein